MWKRMFETSKVMSVRMLGSYLAVLLAPLVAIMVFYAHTNGAMLRVQYEKSYRLLTESATSFERQLNEVRNVSIYLRDDAEVQQFTRG